MGLGNAKGLSQPPLQYEEGSSRAVEKPGFSGNFGNFASRPTVMREIVPSSGSLSPFATMERAVLKLSSSPSLSLSPI